MSSKSGGAKKPGLITRLFSTERKSSLIPPSVPGEDAGHEPSVADEKLRQRRQRLHRLHSMDAATFHDRSACLDSLEVKQVRSPQSPRSPTSPPPASPKSPGRRPHSAKSRQSSSSSSSTSSRPPLSPTEPRSPVTPDSDKSLPTPPTPQSPPARAVSHDPEGPAPHHHHHHHHHHGKKKHLPSSTSLPAEPTTSPQPVATSAPRAKSITTAPTPAAAAGKKLKHRKRIKKKDDNPSTSTKIDTSRPLEFPTTPEVILDYHRQKPFLKSNEEWLVVELNEYECLVDGFEILRIIAKHSKFFEVEPDQLWEEFFEFVEDVPSYDEIINYDVWQEFRDNKYPC